MEYESKRECILNSILAKIHLPPLPPMTRAWVIFFMPLLLELNKNYVTYQKYKNCKTTYTCRRKKIKNTTIYSIVWPRLKGCFECDTGR